MKTKLMLLFCLFGISSIFAQVNLDQGLIAQYEFNEVEHIDQTIPDLTLNNNDVKTYGVFFFDDDRSFQSGEAMMVLSENAIYATINEGGLSNTFAELPQFSVAFYYLFADFNNEEDHHLYSIEDVNGKKLTVLAQITSDNIFFTLRYKKNNTVVFEKAIPYTFDPNSIWNNISFSFDATNNEAKFYLNGILNETINVPLEAFENAKVLLGKSSDGTAGTICFDDMSVYDRILNQEEVFAINEMTPTAVLNADKNKNISIYPIPSTNKIIHIEVRNYSESFAVSLFDQNGKLHIKEQIQSGEAIDIKTLAAGTYYLRIELIEGIFTKKIVLID